MVKINIVDIGYLNICTAYGIRTRATAVKGRRPRPLDERGIVLHNKSNCFVEATGGFEPPYEVLQTSA